MLTSDLFSKLKQLYQGDDWAFTVYLPDYDSSVYTLKFSFASKGIIPFTIQSQAGQGSTFTFSVSATETTSYIPGNYLVTASLLDGTKKTTLGQNEVSILPDLTLVENGDPRHPYRIALDDCEIALASGAGSDVQEYTINGTTVKKNRAGLLALRAFYLSRVRQVTGVAAIRNINFYL